MKLSTFSLGARRFSQNLISFPHIAHLPSWNGRPTLTGCILAFEIERDIDKFYAKFIFRHWFDVKNL